MILNLTLLTLIVLGALPAPAAVPALRRIYRRAGMAPTLGWLALVPGAGCALALGVLVLGRWRPARTGVGERAQ